MTRRPWPDNQAPVFVASVLRQELNRRLKTPVDVYLTTFGLVRGDLRPVGGKPCLLQYSDVFRLLPLGFDARMRPGAPVVSFYLKKQELKKLLEAMAVIAMKSASYDPAASDSLSYSIRGWGVPFYSKIADLKLHGQPIEQWPELVRIGTNEFFARNLKKVKDYSHGLIEIVPRDCDGKPLAAVKELDVPREPELLAIGLKNIKP